MDFKNLEINYIGFCDAHNAEICQCSFTESKIKSCFLDFSTVSGSRWANASFAGMYMEKCRFDEVNLNGSDFDKLSMENSVFVNSGMGGSSFTKVSMNDCSFTDSNFKNSKFSGVDFSGAEIDESCDISGLTINGISAEELLKRYKEDEET